MAHSKPLLLFAWQISLCRAPFIWVHNKGFAVHPRQAHDKTLKNKKELQELLVAAPLPVLRASRLMLSREEATRHHLRSGRPHVRRWGRRCRSPRTSMDGGDRPSVHPCGREKRGVQSFSARREVEGVTGRRDLPFAWWLEPPPCSSSAPPQPCTSFTIDETTGTTRKEGRVRR
jgi:hypothetical protein